MKFVILSVVLTFYSAITFSQSLSDTAHISRVPSSLVFVSGGDARFVSIAPIRHAGFSADNEGPDQCKKYHKMKFAGSLMTACGGGIFAIGLTMVFIATDDASYYGVMTASDRGQIIGGSVMMGTGAGCLVSGVTLLSIGHANARKYCGDRDSRYKGSRSRGYSRSGRSRSYMELKTNGKGLALNF